VPATVPFWPKPLSIFGLLEVTTFIKSSHGFTIPSIPPHLRLMLADTPFPHGSGASRVTVGTLSEGIRFPVALEKFLAVSQSVCFYDTGLSHLSIPLTS
jgi:hypothetical protein